MSKTLRDALEKSIRNMTMEKKIDYILYLLTEIVLYDDAFMKSIPVNRNLVEAIRDSLGGK